MGLFDVYASVGTEGRFRAIVGLEASGTDLQWSLSPLLFYKAGSDQPVPFCPACS